MQAVIAFAADHRIGTPQAELAIALDGGGEDRLSDIGEVALQQAGDLDGRRRGEPTERAVQALGHPEKILRAALEGGAARHQRGVGGEAARGGGVPQMTRACGQKLLCMGLEELCRLERAGADRRGIVGHRRPREAIEAVGIDTGAAQVVGQADPGRRHFGHRGEFHLGEVGQAEVGPRPGTDHEERIARHDVGEAHEIGIGLAVVHDHHAQRAAPHHVDLARAQGTRGGGRIGRGPQHDLDAGLAEGAGRVGGVERRIEQRAEVLAEDDHGSV